MKNYIIIGIMAVAVSFGIYSAIKHFKGKGGCCGNGSYKRKKKKLTHIRYQKLFTVDGMHCEHCKQRVEEVVNDIQGVCGQVYLKKGELLVSYASDVDDATLQARLEKAGYTVTEIKAL